MKKILVVLLSLALMFCMASCAKKWTCDECDKTYYGKAYYDMNGFPMCEDCAITYWMPFPYQNYEIK